MATVLNPGDIAFVGFNFDNPDEFAFVPLVNLDAGTEITFTDNGWQAAGQFRATEGTFTWTAPNAIAAGTIVTPAVSSVLFSASGDQILAYQGPATSPTFIAALNSEGAGIWQDDATSSNSSALPTGLVDGSTAVALSEIDNAVYIGPTSGTRAELLAALNDANNWSGSNSTRQTLPTQAFIIDSDPAPREIVINEVLASHSGTDTTEFVELFGAAGASLEGLSLIAIEADASAPGAIDLRIDFSADDAIGENGFFLIGNPAGLADDYGVTPDIDLGNDSIENGNQTLALVETASLTGASVTGGETVVDAVALANGDPATFFFDAPVLGPDGSFFPAGVRRVEDGVDTDQASDWVFADFFLGPQNTPTPATGDEPPEPEMVKIHEIQGAGDESPIAGQTVTIQAIVVADYQDGVGEDGDLNGFFVQEEDADADADGMTSEGLFIFDGSDPVVDVSKGDLVTVTGTVAEFNGSTQLTGVTVTVDGFGNALPTVSGINLPEDSDTLEAYEGMLVEVENTLTITEYFNYDRFGEIRLFAGDTETPDLGFDVGFNGRPYQFTQLNAPSTDGFAAFRDEVESRQIIFDDGRTTQNPDGLLLPDGTPFSAENSFRGGDQVTDLGGVLTFAFGEYRIQPVVSEFSPEIIEANPRPEAPDDVGGSLTVSSFNVLNFFTTLDEEGNPGSGPNSLSPRGADTPEEFDRQLEKLTTAIQSLDADILGLIELENEFGFDQNGDSQFAIDVLVEALNASGDRTYDYVDPGRGFVDTGDAISNGFIYDTQTVEVTFGTSAAILDDSVLPDLGMGDLGPIFDGTSTNRASLATTFTELETGGTFTVAVNHFKSKGGNGEGDDADIGDGQGNFNGIRTDAAKALAAWLETDPTGSGDSDFMIIGDLNAYAQEDPITALRDAGYTDVFDLFGDGEEYSFLFDGTVGALDYVLVNESLAAQLTGATKWGVNADEPDIIDYNLDFGRDPNFFEGDIPFRNSDHDPLLIGLDLAPPPATTAVARVEFVDGRFRDKAVYSLDGEEVSSDKLRFLQRDIEIEEAGLTFSADDGKRFSPEFISAIGDGIGVWSFRGDKFFGRDRKLLDQKETITLDIEETDGLGDALSLLLEFKTRSDDPALQLEFFSDGASVGEATVDVVDGIAAYEFDDAQTFDSVEIGVERGVAGSILAVELTRELDDLFPVA